MDGVVFCIDFLNELNSSDGLGKEEEEEQEEEEMREEGEGEGVRRRRRESVEQKGDAGEGGGQEAEYTPEQKEAVDR